MHRHMHYKEAAAGPKVYIECPSRMREVVDALEVRGRIVNVALVLVLVRLAVRVAMMLARHLGGLVLGAVVATGFRPSARLLGTCSWKRESSISQKEFPQKQSKRKAAQESRSDIMAFQVA